MESELRWENEAHTVIRLSLSGNWDWAGFYAAIGQPDLVNQDAHTCTIVDLRGVTRIPSDAARHFKLMAQMMIPVQGAVVVIATSNAAQMTYHLAMTIYKPLAAKIYLAESDQEAYALLQMPAP